jgi:hypothetical protein
VISGCFDGLDIGILGKDDVLKLLLGKPFMSVNSEPANSLRDLEQALADLSGMPRRVQVQQVLPLVEKLHAHGFTFADIAKRMSEAGLSFQPNSLKLAVHRWRKKRGEPVEPDSGASDVPVRESFLDQRAAQLKPPGAEVTVLAPSASVPLTKALLQGIRDEHIDLDDIKKQARLKRSKD